MAITTYTTSNSSLWALAWSDSTLTSNPINDQIDKWTKEDKLKQTKQKWKKPKTYCKRDKRYNKFKSIYKKKVRKMSNRGK